MIVNYCLSFILLVSTHFLSFTSTLQTEILPNGKKVIFFETSKKTLSQKQLEKIEKDINTRINSLSKQFKNQSPKKNLLSLFQLKIYLDHIYKEQHMKYATANTRLDSQILFLSDLLSSLPNKKKFQPKHCQRYTHKLRIKAHVSVNSDELDDWVSQILKLSEQLCPKNTKNQIAKLNQTGFEFDELQWRTPLRGDKPAPEISNKTNINVLFTEKTYSKNIFLPYTAKCAL